MLALRETRPSNGKLVGSIAVKGAILVVRSQCLELYCNGNKVKEHRTYEVIVACCGYVSKHNDSKEYLFTLSQSGAIRILEVNSDCDNDSGPLVNVVSEYQSFINVTALYPQFSINRTKSHLFVNLNDYDVFVLKFYDKKNGMVIQEPIVGDDEENLWVPIYMASGKIKYFTVVAFDDIVDDNGNKNSWIELALVVNANQRWRFETAKPLTTIKVQSRWKSNRCLELPQSEHAIPFSADLFEYVFGYIPYFGYYIVSLTHIVIIAFNHGYLCNIGGTLVTELATFESIDNHCDLDDDTLGIISDLHVSENTYNLEFSLVTNKKEKISFQLNIVQTDAYDSVTHLSNFNYKRELLPIADEKLRESIRVQLAEKPCLLINLSSGIFLLYHQELECPALNSMLETSFGTNIIDHGLISDEFPVEYSSGVETRTGQPFLEYKYFGLEPLKLVSSNYSTSNDENIMKLKYEPLTSIKESWVDGNSICWRDEFDTIFKNGQEVLRNGEAKYIFNDSLVTLDNLATKINYFQVGDLWCYSFVSHTGRFHTSLSENTFDIKTVVDTPTLKNIFSTSIGVSEQYLLSTIIVDDEILVLKNMSLAKKYKLGSGISRVVDLDIHQTQDGRANLLITDLDGRLFCIDIHTGKIFQQVIIGKLASYICPKLDSEYWIIYSREYMGLLSFNSVSGLYEYSLMLIPQLIKSILHCNNGIYLIADDNNIFEIFIGKMDKTLVTVRNKTSFQLSNSVIFSHSNRIIIQRFIDGLNSDNEVDQESIAVTDLYTGKVLDVFSLSTRYENTRISCMSGVEYKHDNKLNRLKKGEISYAKVFAISRCVVVALDTSNIEESNIFGGPKNLLLFSVEEDTGKLTLEASISTGFNVTTVHNYLYRTFLVGGESVSLYQIDYLVKENRFIIDRVSNNPNGIICALSAQPYSSRVIKPTSQLGTKVQLGIKTQMSYRVLLQDKFKGIIEFELLVLAKNKQGAQPDDLHVEFKPVINKNIIPLNNIIDNNNVINSLNCREINGTTYFLVVYNSKQVIIAFVSPDGSFGYHEFALPSTVKLVTMTMGSSIMDDDAKGIDLFRLVTDTNTCYALTIDAAMTISQDILESMEEHLPELAYVNGADDKTELQFVDMRFVNKEKLLG